MIEKKILFRTVVEMLGRPKDHLQEMLKGMVEVIKANEAFEVVNFHIEEPVEQETMFSSFVELEIKVTNADDIAWFCFDFLPASVEVIEPEEIVFTSQGMSSFMNELTTRMHIIDKELKNLSQENAIINSKAKMIIKNSVLVALTRKDMTLNEITKYVGIQGKLLDEIVEELVKGNLIEKLGDIYHLT